MLIRLIFTTLLLMPSVAALANDAIEHQFCDRYAVLNNQFTAKGGSPADGCGPSGYLLHFGHRFCNMFVNKNSSFSPAGQRAMYNIRHCLIETLEEQSSQLTCDKVRRAGINSHYGCYMKSGFCQMPIQDKMEVYYLLRSQAFSWDAILNSLSISGGCDSQNGYPSMQQNPVF